MYELKHELTRRTYIRRRIPVMDNRIDAISWEAILRRVRSWAEARESRYVCLCNLHSLVVGRRSAEFRKAVQEADTAVPEGMPVAWLMRRRGVILQERIDGATLMWRCAERAAIDGTPVFLYGANQSVMEQLLANLKHYLPGLTIAGHAVASERTPNAEEEDHLIARIVGSGARIVFTGLGSPSAEIWMANTSKRIPAVLIGVGSAFEYHARPRRSERTGRVSFERLLRLWNEPQHLWHQYCVPHALFAYYVLSEGLLVRRTLV